MESIKVIVLLFVLCILVTDVNGYYRRGRRSPAKIRDIWNGIQHAYSSISVGFNFNKRTACDTTCVDASFEFMYESKNNDGAGVCRPHSTGLHYLAELQWCQLYDGDCRRTSLHKNSFINDMASMMQEEP